MRTADEILPHAVASRLADYKRTVENAQQAAGRVFNAPKDGRTAADYDKAVVPPSEEARDVSRAAVDLLAVRYGFQRSSP